MHLPTGTEDYFKLSVEEFDTTKLLAHAAKIRDARNYDKMLIIDADAHHYESESFEEIVSYMDNEVIRQLAQASLKLGRSSMFGTNRVGYQDIGGRITRYPLRKTEKTDAPGARRDVELAHRWMDAIGVDYACIFPTPMLSLGLHPQVEVEAQLALAYNRWLTERVLSASSRLKSMLYLPLNDPKSAMRVVEEFGDKKGVIGFMVTSVRHRPVYDNAYAKLYAMIEERGLPLAFHSGFNWDDDIMKHANRFITVHALGFTWHNVFHCTNWIVNGMPERFPKLKVIWIEGGLAWATWLGQRLDSEYRMRSSECPLLKKLPSEYMQEMFYTCQPMEQPKDRGLLESTFRAIKADTQLLYASDYPHWDMDLPSVIYDLPFLDETAKRNILGENARRLFRIDVAERFPDYRPAA